MSLVVGLVQCPIDPFMPATRLRMTWPGFFFSDVGRERGSFDVTFVSAHARLKCLSPPHLLNFWSLAGQVFSLCGVPVAAISACIVGFTPSLVGFLLGGIRTSGGMVSASLAEGHVIAAYCFFTAARVYGAE